MCGMVRKMWLNLQFERMESNWECGFPTRKFFMTYGDDCPHDVADISLTGSRKACVVTNELKTEVGQIEKVQLFGVVHLRGQREFWQTLLCASQGNVEHNDIQKPILGHQGTH